MQPRNRLAVIDLGSNSFRLVVFTAARGWWQRTDEIYQPVRIGEGMAATGRLGGEPMRRALAALDVFDHFCAAAGLLEQSGERGGRAGGVRNGEARSTRGGGGAGDEGGELHRAAGRADTRDTNASGAATGNENATGSGGTASNEGTTGNEDAATAATAVDAVATSAIRDAENAPEFLARARARTKLPIRVLSREQEARYGYLAAVNSTTLADGCVLDLGGGSLQLVRVRERIAHESGSWRVGAVRMTERFLPGPNPPKRAQLQQLREHVAEQLASAAWLPRAGRRLVGIGGTVRSLAAVAQRAEGLPSNGVQGMVVSRKALAQAIERLAALPPAERANVPGVKPARADLILAGAVVVEGALNAGGFEALEVTEAGLREGVFFERYLSEEDGWGSSGAYGSQGTAVRRRRHPSEKERPGPPACGRLRNPPGTPEAPGKPPLFADVRRASVLNLAARYRVDRAHTRHVAALALGMFDQLARLGLHGGDPTERGLLWAASMLHDIGMSVDYDDHHKHSRYLILSAGLPGYSPVEAAIVAQAARYHRKGLPDPGPLAALFGAGDAARLDRCAVLLRLAEDLERSRDQLVRDTEMSSRNGTVRLRLLSDNGAAVARWAASRESELFARAFGRRLAVV